MLLVNVNLSLSLYVLTSHYSENFSYPNPDVPKACQRQGGRSCQRWTCLAPGLRHQHNRREPLEGNLTDQWCFRVDSYMIYSDRDKSWPIHYVISQGQSVKTYPGHYVEMKNKVESSVFMKLESKLYIVNTSTPLPSPLLVARLRREASL